ncbi:MAG: S24 family peptidase [Thermodesulfobacteriota bacterium]
MSRARAELSAGGGQVVISEGFSEHYAFRRQWLSRIGIAKNQAAMMQVRGDSMSPTLEEGDTVIVDFYGITIHYYRIYAIGMGDLIAVKRMEFKGPTTKMISDNKAYYDA